MKIKFVVTMLAFIISLVMQIGFGAEVVYADEFRVTEKVDRAQSCQPNSCSLREAIIAANALPGEDTIIIPAGTYNLTIAGPVENESRTGDLDITDPLKIVGAGTETTIINGNGLSSDAKTRDRVFEVLKGHVSMTNLTIQNGATYGQEDGGGILYNFEEGILSIVNVKLANNTARYGGAISNEGDHAIINIVNCTIEGNKAVVKGGGVTIFNVEWADVNIIGTSIIKNQAEDGGGVYFLSNSAGGEKVVLNIINSTIGYNTATEYGGGIVNDGNGQVNLQSTTIFSNTSGNNVDGNGGGGGIASLDQGVFRISHAIIAGNRDSSVNKATDCYASQVNFVNSMDYNLIGNVDGCHWVSKSHDKTKLNPDLVTTLSGMPPVYALSKSSSAIGAGSAILGTALGQCPFIDQRGLGRKVPCDIGAYQNNAVSPALSIDLIKSGPDTIRLNQLITYTLNVINSSHVTATQAVITDVIPEGANYVSGGTKVGNAVVWTPAEGIVPPHTVLQVSFVVTSDQALINKDYRINAKEYEGQGFNQVGTDFVLPDLVITKRGTMGTQIGLPITYTITIENKGKGSADNLVITDTVPTGTSYKSGGSLQGNVVSWTIPELLPKGIEEVNFTVMADTLPVRNADYRVSSNDGVYSSTGQIVVVTTEATVYLPLVVKK